VLVRQSSDKGATGNESHHRIRRWNREDRAGVSGILEPVKSRFTTIIEMEPDVDDWTNWATSNNIRPEIIAFIRIRRKLLID
jgi:hypothetical protein